jgi:ribosome biogenesis GTPase
MNLKNLGWNNFFERHFEQFRNQGLVPARVAQEHKGLYFIYSQHGELSARISGKLRHGMKSRAEFPAVGDWVAVQSRPDEHKATILALLPRKSLFSRKAVLSGGMPDSGGKTEEQVLSANVDTVFLVCGLDVDFNPRRIERYLAVAWDSRASPVIVLNKVDLCSDVNEKVAEVESIAFGIPIHPVSAMKNQGLEILQKYLRRGKTAVLLGSSGVGKSSIINKMLGEGSLKVSKVRAYNGRGRHTTAYRQMILLPSGGVFIDTPGMRELALWGNEEGLERTFNDIRQLALGCRFRDCSHQDEPGCAVQRALKDGILTAGRYKNYLRLRKELKHLALRQDTRARRSEERTFDKKIRQRLKAQRKIEGKGKL